MDDIRKSWFQTFEHFLINNDMITILSFDSDGKVLHANAGARHFLAAETPPPSVFSIFGNSFRSQLETLIPGETGHHHVRLMHITPPVGLNCIIQRTENAYLLAGLFETIDQESVIQNLSLQHSEVLNLYRDTMRQKAELESARAKIKVLQGFLPICSSCKKVRDDKGYWNRIEEYIRDHSEAEFSHGLCPDCEKSFFDEPE